MRPLRDMLFVIFDTVVEDERGVGRGVVESALGGRYESSFGT